jgi:ribosomal protein S18 acetylase RimI-like enzyme
VARNALRVRQATDADLPALVELGEELRDVTLPATNGTGRARTPAARIILEQRYREALGSPDRRVVVVVDADDEPVGMALFTVSPANPLVDTPSVHMTHSVVSRRHERRGAGKALVAAAAAYADERGIDQLVVSVNPASREGNRFFARLGFAPLAVRRVAPVQVVRRRLAQTELTTLEHVARRRPRGVAALPMAPSDS